MATLVLGTVGRVLGGPIGGAVGTLLGGAVDRRLFGGGSSGPRLADLSVQSSAYGQPLPRVYGRMRVAGNLIWTAGIKESSQRSGSKLTGSGTSYSYSASFAVIVASRAIVAVGQIWADGKLLRAADGTLNYPATIRTYRGDEFQGVDPLIAAAEGQSAAPAYRGRAYLVFEDMPLADYGNRIPNLTFEVIADETSLGIDAIAVDIGAGLIAAQGVFPVVAGFAAVEAGTIRQSLTTLGNIADLSLGDDGHLLIAGVGQATTALVDTDLGATDKNAPLPQRHESRDADTVVPDAIWFSYFDLARDYQTGVQAATRRTPIIRVDQRDLTVAADACDVKTLAEASLRRAIAGRTTAQFNLPWRYAVVGPGDIVRTAEDAQPWRVTHRTITGAVIELEVERIAAPVSGVTPVADAGSVYVGPDAPQGATFLHVLDLPALPGILPAGPQLLIAAAGTDNGWRRADILVSQDGGETYQLATSVEAPATIGTALSALSSGTTVRWDRQSTVDVELLSDAMDLQSASEAAVLGGANLAAVGNELIQFASVEALGARRFRLSDLLRGRRGSEAAITDHVIGEAFVVLDDKVVPLAVPAEALGASLAFKAAGPADNPAVLPARAIVPLGVGLRPLSPATVSIVVSGGDRVVEWVRRSRAGYPWSDGTDAPVAEESERYHVMIRGAAGILREVDVTMPLWTYAAADLATDIATSPSLTVEVAQISAVVGRGLPTVAQIA